ncbi:MAG TPA: hypothetical protein EYQ07_06735 [Candidatus Poseidoniales archaeon]|nr:MAG: hypothetical protein CXT64_06720 [Euryarchaeota archaeon]HIE82200.1 hypothetical protein [Candidatus Poseidoniales archaeon]
MKILGIHIPFTNQDYHPFQWFDGPDTIKIDAGPSKISFTHSSSFSGNFMRILGGMLLFGLGFMFILGSAWVIAGDSIIGMNNEESKEPCWPNQDTAITLSDGEVFCKFDTYTDGYSNYQIADDYYSLEMYGEEQKYRWSEENGIITDAYHYDDSDEYYCMSFIRASALPENWTADDLIIGETHGDDAYPEWCWESPDNSNVVFNDTNSTPFDGELLYEMYPSDELYPSDVVSWINTIQYKEDGGMINTFYESSRFMGAGGNSIMGFFGFLLMGIFTMSFGLMFRKRVIMFDTATNQITEEFIKRPRFGTIRSEMKVPISVDIVKNTRVVHHRESGDEHSSGRTWTTTHRGIDIMVDLVGQGPKAVLFLEGKNPQTEFESILELLFSTLGIKDEEEGQKWWESDDQS